MILIHIIRYNNILKILSIISFIILIILLNNNVYYDLKKKSDLYNSISISCKANNFESKNVFKICANIFEHIFKDFYNIKINDQELANYYERKITIYKEFQKGFIKSGKGYFNFYIYKSENDKLNLKRFLEFIEIYKKEISMAVFYKNKEFNSHDSELKMIFDKNILININFE